MRNNHRRSQNLNGAQGQLLVRLARHTLMDRLGKQIPQAEIDSLNTALKDSCFKSSCGTFVTLKIDERLRGCIGNLTSDTPLASGVRRNAINAAFHDPRFAPLRTSELDRVEIEISILSEPQPLKYRDADDLIKKLRPHIDGVIIRKVWEQLPRPQDFLAHLCMKAGLAADSWQNPELEVSTYQVQYFEEHTGRS
jgi:AmmeMemoRadiSam system protein A